MPRKIFIGFSLYCEEQVYYPYKRVRSKASVFSVWLASIARYGFRLFFYFGLSLCLPLISLSFEQAVGSPSFCQVCLSLGTWEIGLANGAP